MKKLIFSIFIMLYVVSNIGATIQLHMCCGDIVNWSVKEIADSSSQHKSCCGAEKNESHEQGTVCCEDTQFSIKLDEPQILLVSDYLFNHGLTCSEKYFFNFSQYFDTRVEDENLALFPQPPPRLSEKLGLFIYFRNLKLDC